jgi:hypothetical protein
MRLSLCALSLSAVVLNQFTPVHAPFGKSKIAAQTIQSIMLAAINDTA